MTAREELHILVDRLSDDAAALAYVRHLIQVPQSGSPTAQDRLARRMGPSAQRGSALWPAKVTDNRRWLERRDR
jgi:hypothetical protein